MNEWIMILTMAVGLVLWSAGGTHIEELGGQKWLRRYLYPLFLALIGYLNGVLLWKVICIALVQFASFSAGYGESKPYWYKFLVGCAWVLPIWLINWTWWIAITPIYWIIMFALSNLKYTANIFRWKYVEAFCGLLIAITYCNAILN